MHENRNLYLFLIEINNMHRTRHILRTNIQDLYSGLMQPMQPVRCFVTSCYNIFANCSIMSIGLSNLSHIWFFSVVIGFSSISFRRLNFGIIVRAVNMILRHSASWVSIHMAGHMHSGYAYDACYAIAYTVYIIYCMWLSTYVAINNAVWLAAVVQW